MTRRTGDTINIPGAYQYEAARARNPVQRFWHFNKKLMVSGLLPPESGDRVVDLGCGSGVISDFLGETAGEVVAVDSNEEAVEFARKTFNRPNVSYRVGLADDLGHDGPPVDKVYCLEVIEHLAADQARSVLEQLKEVLKPGGALLLTTPNYRSLWPLLELLMDLFRLAPRLRDDQHVEHYNPRSLHRLCTESGFRVEYLGTSCLVAPWVAGLSWRWAEQIARSEIRWGSRLGAIVMAVLRKPGEHDGC